MPSALDDFGWESETPGYVNCAIRSLSHAQMESKR
jgi:hypothetical protein